jgi:hypothetical protein
MAISMPTLVNVCGAGRAGTTMLDLMLGSAPNAFSCGEVYAWFRPWRSHHKRIVCSCQQDPCPQWEKMKDGPERRFHARAASALGMDFIIDSSKELCWVLDTQMWAAETGLRVVNVALWKDPVDLAFSYWKRGWGIDSWWKHFLRYHQRLLQVEFPFIAVNFSDLVADPAQQLKHLCAALGMEYLPGQEEFWQHEHHHLFGSLGTRRQLEAGRSHISAAGREFPEEFARLIPGFLARVERDPIANEVLSDLKARSADRTSNERYSFFVPPRMYPVWYYISGFKRRVRKRFPQKWAHSQ